MFILLHLILGFACVLNLVVVLFLWWIFLSDQCFLFFVCVFALILFEWMAVSLPLTCHKHNTMKSGKNGLMTHHVTAISKTTTNCIERMVCILALIGCWPCPKNRCKTAKNYEAKKLSSSSLHVAGPALMEGCHRGVSICSSGDQVGQRDIHSSHHQESFQIRNIFPFINPANQIQATKWMSTWSNHPTILLLSDVKRIWEWFFWEKMNIKGALERAPAHEHFG